MLIFKKENVMEIWKGNNKERFNDLSNKLIEENRNPTSYERKVKLRESFKELMEDQWGNMVTKGRLK